MKKLIWYKTKINYFIVRKEEEPKNKDNEKVEVHEQDISDNGSKNNKNLKRSQTLIWSDHEFRVFAILFGKVRLLIHFDPIQLKKCMLYKKRFC